MYKVPQRILDGLVEQGCCPRGCAEELLEKVGGDGDEPGAPRFIRDRKKGRKTREADREVNEEWQNRLVQMGRKYATDLANGIGFPHKFVNLIIQKYELRENDEGTSGYLSINHFSRKREIPVGDEGRKLDYPKAMIHAYRRGYDTRNIDSWKILASQEHKIHLQPNPRHLPLVLDRLVRAAQSDKELAELIVGLKVNMSCGMESKDGVLVPQASEGVLDAQDSGIQPAIVVYLKLGDDANEAALRKIHALFGEMRSVWGSGNVPRNSRRCGNRGNRLVYRADGSTDLRREHPELYANVPAGITPNSQEFFEAARVVYQEINSDVD